MTASEPVILIVNHSPQSATDLKGLIEFMDTPLVKITEPANWRDTLGEGRLQALFVGPDMDAGEVAELLDEVGNLDPNVAIVMLKEEAGK